MNKLVERWRSNMISIFVCSMHPAILSKFRPRVSVLEDFEFTLFFFIFPIFHTIMVKIFGNVLPMPAPPRPPQSMLGLWPGSQHAQLPIQHWYGGGGWGVWATQTIMFQLTAAVVCCVRGSESCQYILTMIVCEEKIGNVHEKCHNS